MTLHAWIRRAASKVTVAYDASALKEGVFIYLKSVQIKDIPTHCYLGKDNKVGAEDEGYDLPFPAKGEDMPDGEVIKYYEGDTEPTVFDASYPVRLSTGKSYYPWPVEENGVLHKKDTKKLPTPCFSSKICKEKAPANCRMPMVMENWIIPDCREIIYYIPIICRKMTCLMALTSK